MKISLSQTNAKLIETNIEKSNFLWTELYRITKQNKFTADFIVKFALKSKKQ
ncbi:hypothetical protein NUZ5A_50255 [Candidatus Nitrosotenuis uzonensis]|uniref:Uncharacterized protein n=1 Tax=Candidatus Nitrosotenuis uzonensis TaxID=1407055 RepID=A0A812F6H7_9ARCH|nr:hypothetical protein NUZ5A_50255 [Candidatus Nitrosotenuis uzonensis]